MKPALLTLTLLGMSLGTTCQGPAASGPSTDTDGDTLWDSYEQETWHTNPFSADTDADGLLDGDEVFVYLTDPLRKDTDEDGLTDGDEVNVYLTDPLVSDTDADGLSDGKELQPYLATNPLVADTDGDGFTDGQEWTWGFLDPLSPDLHGSVAQVLYSNLSDFVVVASPVAIGVYQRFGTSGEFPSGFLPGDVVAVIGKPALGAPTGEVCVNLSSGETGLLGWCGVLDGNIRTIASKAWSDGWLRITLSSGPPAFIVLPSDTAKVQDWHVGQSIQAVRASDVGVWPYILVNVNLCENATASH